MSDSDIKVTVAKREHTVSIEVQRGSETPVRFELTHAYAASLRRHLEWICTRQLDQIHVRGGEGGLVHVEAGSVILGLSVFLPATPEAPDGGVGGPLPWRLPLPVARKLLADLGR